MARCELMKKLLASLRSGRRVPRRCRTNHRRGGKEEQSRSGEDLEEDARGWAKPSIRTEGAGTSSSFSGGGIRLYKTNRASVYEGRYCPQRKECSCVAGLGQRISAR